ncbi:hypothetical protein ABZ714_30710 [Streptomyces sp. NPDC006798]|uniref:hypothetical protein n=1 Tax=unclassified Streptomyces TaxID=2593676 RepID=UPI0033313113
MGGPLQRYRYRGTVLKLNDQDAKTLGLGEDDLVGAPATADDGPAEAVSNKARTTAQAKPGRSRRKSPSPGAVEGGRDDSTVTEPPGPAGDGGPGGGGGD